MSEKSQEEIKEETQKWMEEQKKKTGNVTINIMGAKKGSEEQKEAPKENENKEFPTSENMRAFAKALIKAEGEETEEMIRLDIQKKNAEREEKEYKEGGKGILGMTPEMLAKEQHDSGKKEFDSVEEMVNWARENDPESYAKIKEKAQRGLMNNSFEWTDTFTKDGKFDRSLIGRTLDRANDLKRRGKGE